jgi:enoyl-CoA hydratase/carnithine racemase
VNEQWKGLAVREEGGVSWVTIDRVEDRNSLDSETISELGRHLEGAEKADGRAIVYRGAGGTHFIGGADGVEMYEMAPDGARGFSRRIQELFTRMESSRLFLVAAIDGLCFGGGLEFALACDLRLATEAARLGLPEVRLGIIPGGGGTQRLPRVVGFGRAAEMVLGGRLYGADEALNLGLVSAVVPAADLERRAAEAVRRVTETPRHSFVAAKQALNASRNLPLPQGLALESDRFADCFREPYFADRVREQLADGRLTTTRGRKGERKADEHADA